MQLTISTDADDLTQALSGFVPPLACEEVAVYAPRVRKAVNLFLGSPINSRVRFLFPDAAINMAGLFSLCSDLQHQPVIEGNSTATSLAASFKGNTECRYSMHWLAPFTKGCRDYRQMFWGATNFSGNGVQAFDYAAVTPPSGMRNFFGGGSGIRMAYYDLLIETLHAAMKDGTLPTPMTPVDMGTSVCSPLAKPLRDELIAYGWDIQDGGDAPDNRSPLERVLCDDFAEPADTGCVCTSARNGILISPLHTLHVKHFIPPNGSTLTFRSGESANVVSSAASPVQDIAVVTLDRPITAKPVAFLPDNWHELMPNASGPPSRYLPGHAPGLLWFNRNNVAAMADLSYVQMLGRMRKSVIPARAAQWQDVAVGDSGSPVCLVYKGELVIAWPMATSSGSGVWIDADMRRWIESIVGQPVRTI